MKHFYILILACIFCLKLTAQREQAIALLFLDKLDRKQYDSCFAMMDTTMQSKVPPGMLSRTWESLPNYLGDYKGREFVSAEVKDSLHVFYYRYSFEKMKLDMCVTVDSQQKITGARLTPPKSNTAYTPPDYYKPETFYETKLAVKTGTFELPGMLCVPNNISDPPVVILVAGSGPHDKDESIGPTKALKDLAIGLAANGIASLRYDKRTFVYGEEIVKNNLKLGINEEVVDDALSAVEILRKHRVTSRSKIIIAGHSLGAMCAPLIASKSRNVHAIILLAGNARPLEDLVLEQYNYIFGLDSLTSEEKETLRQLKDEIKTVKDPKALKNASADQLPLGLPSYYWQSLKSYDQVKTAKKLRLPILVLQGERDYQVTMTDFKLWTGELNSQPKNRFISYPDLNHLFIKGVGRATPKEYEKPGNVDWQVIRDISDWIKAN